VEGSGISWMERIDVPTTISFQALLRVLDKRPLDPCDHYRNVYIIQMMQRLQILINQDKRKLAGP
jgi:hypothetical protein